MSHKKDRKDFLDSVDSCVKVLLLRYAETNDEKCLKLASRIFKAGLEMDRLFDELNELEECAEEKEQPHCENSTAEKECRDNDINPTALIIARLLKKG